MKRDDPSTWTPLTEEESPKLSAQQPAVGGEPYFNGKGHRFYIRNGTEPLILDLAPRALWQIVGYLKTPEAVPDALAADDTDGDIWRDWSEAVRAAV